ncbi:unnamed protein product [Linum tenue]|uniref:Homeobox-leucine zipper protein n=2 Tax=Linum tenue TaxID=586396 RepID=A0AAV0JL32_9ROSI|nr:unnamed protein product [Linum tenue]
MGKSRVCSKRRSSDSNVHCRTSMGRGEEEEVNMEQVKTLEKNFELGNKLETDGKMQLARPFDLQPRQIAIWFQNRGAGFERKGHLVHTRTALITYFSLFPLHHISQFDDDDKSRTSSRLQEVSLIPVSDKRLENDDPQVLDSRQKHNTRT